MYFSDTESVERAIDDTEGVPCFQDTTTLKFVRCKVTQADPKNTIYVGNIPPTLNEEQIIQEIERICNERVLRFELHMNPDGTSKCYGWARFSDHETALLCIQTLNSTPFPSSPPALLETDRPLATKFALPRAIPPKLFRTIKSLYVKNIDPSYPIEEIRELFGGVDLVERVFLPTQKGTSMFLGTAIIFYHNREDAERYIRLMDGKVLNGRIVHVEWCLPKSPPMNNSNPNNSNNINFNANNNNNNNNNNIFNLNGMNGMNNLNGLNGMNGGNVMHYNHHNHHGHHSSSNSNTNYDDGNLFFRSAGSASPFSFSSNSLTPLIPPQSSSSSSTSSLTSPSFHDSPQTLLPTSQQGQGQGQTPILAGATQPLNSHFTFSANDFDFAKKPLQQQQQQGQSQQQQQQKRGISSASPSSSLFYSSCPQSPTILSIGNSAGGTSATTASSSTTTTNGSKKYTYQPSSLANEFTKYQKTKQSQTIMSPLLTHKLQLPPSPTTHTSSFTLQSPQQSHQPMTPIQSAAAGPGGGGGGGALKSPLFRASIVTPVITSVQGMPNFPLNTPSTFSYPAGMFAKSNVSSLAASSTSSSSKHGTPSSLVPSTSTPVPPLLGSGNESGSAGAIGTPSESLNVDGALSEDFSLLSPCEFKQDEAVNAVKGGGLEQKNNGLTFSDENGKSSLLQKNFLQNPVGAQKISLNPNVISSNVVVGGGGVNSPKFYGSDDVGFLGSAGQQSKLRSSQPAQGLPSLKDMASSPLFSPTSGASMSETYKKIDNVLLLDTDCDTDCNDINNGNNGFEMSFNINEPIFGGINASVPPK